MRAAILTARAWATRTAREALKGASTGLEVAGAGAVVVGVGLIYVPAAWIVGGLLAIALGFAIGADE